jgi:hypothetical protein
MSTTLVMTKLSQLDSPEAMIELLGEANFDTVVAVFSRRLTELSPKDLAYTKAGLQRVRNRLELDEKAARAGLLTVRRERLAAIKCRAAELEVRTEREMGLVIDAQPVDVGGRRDNPARQIRAELGLSGKRWQADDYRKLATIPEPEFERTLLSLREAGKPIASSQVVTSAKRLNMSGDEYYTPPEKIERARACLGGQIGCDPFSNLAVQAAYIRALQWYSGEDPIMGEREEHFTLRFELEQIDFDRAIASFAGIDSLRDDAPWVGPIWLQPPYSAELIAAAFAKARALMELPDFAGLLALVNIDTSKPDQQDMIERGPTCLLSDRIAFLTPKGEPLDQNRSTQILFSARIEPHLFRRAWESEGAIIMPASSKWAAVLLASDENLDVADSRVLRGIIDRLGCG